MTQDTDVDAYPAEFRRLSAQYRAARIAAAIERGSRRFDAEWHAQHGGSIEQSFADAFEDTRPLAPVIDIHTRRVIG